MVGWLSWYHHGPWIEREELLAHARLLAGEEYRGLGYRLIQLDDGWQDAYGDWQPNTKFPGGICALSRDLGQLGQTTGLWTAPFLVSASADEASQATCQSETERSTSTSMNRPGFRRGSRGWFTWSGLSRS